MAALGYAAEATQDAYARAEELSGGSRTRRASLQRSTASPCTPARTASSGAAATSACGSGGSPRRRATRTRRSRPTCCSPSSSCLRGEFEDGFAAVRRALAIWDPERHRPHMFSFGQEPGVATYAAHVFLLAWTGRIDDARRVGAEGLEVARRIGHPLSLAYLLAGVGVAELVAGDPGRVARVGAELGDVTTAHDLSMWSVWADILCAWAQARDGDLDGGLAAARAALDARAEIGFLGMQPYFLAVVAELAVDAGGLDVAEALLADGRAARRVVGRADRRAGARARHRAPRAGPRRPPRRAARARAGARRGRAVIGTPIVAVHAARDLAELRTASDRSRPLR